MGGVYVVELIARTAAEGQVPLRHGTCILSEVTGGCMTSVAPFQGQVAALDAALLDTYGLRFPSPNCVTHSERATCLWMGRGLAFLVGTRVAPQIAQYAALTDQSDAWVTLDLIGADTAVVMARLVPIDLCPAAFGPGTCARTLLGHANVSLECVENGVRIRGFRSMTRTIVHEIADAMAGVAARATVD